jgi:methionyl-tRNA formyltransferase
MTIFRLIYAGTPDFSTAALAALIKSPHTIVSVLTQPDRPSGRGQNIHFSPIKNLALEHDLPILQPKKLDASFASWLKKQDCDILITCAYGIIFPQAILDIPRYGCMNIHASLLPRWRGAAPIQRAILNGDTESGISFMQMDASLDTGDTCACIPCPIKPEDSSHTLEQRLASLSAEHIGHIVDQWPSLPREPQDHSQASYAKKIKNHEAEIDWNSEPEKIMRTILGFNPWPTAYTYLEGQRLKIIRAQISPIAATTKAPGTLLKADASGLLVSTTSATKAINIQSLQCPGKKPILLSTAYHSLPSILSIGNQFTLIERSNEH